MNTMPTKALRLKVRPEAWPWLDQAAREVNLVWNWANATTAKAARPYYGAPRYLSGFDLEKLAKGATYEFDRIASGTIQCVLAEHADCRRQAKRSRLRWRKSGGSRRSLGWVPFKAADIKRKGSALRLVGKTFRVFEPELLGSAKLRQGQFSPNALGEWFVTIAVNVEADDAPAPREAVGIDLGLKAVATTSDGECLPALAAYRSLDAKIGGAQRRGHKRQAKRLHRKAVNRRTDALHKFSTGIIRQYQHIVIGDVSAPHMARTRLAKAVLDSGWGMLKAQLQYKGQWAGRSVEVVSERNTTRACSSCGQYTGPSGLRQLVVREWTCVGCGAAHDRDVNAARNILALRQQRPFAGTRGALRRRHDCRPARPLGVEARP
jgi:putative transposase